MPFMGGASFENKLQYVQEYFLEHQNEKNPQVKIFGYSNASWANVLALDGICSYQPTQYTSHFIRMDDLAKLKEVEKPSAEQLSYMRYLEYFEEQAKRLKGVMNGGAPEIFPRKVLFSPEAQADENGYTMHYPFNVDVLDGIYLKPQELSFKPKANENWSFAIEWMRMQVESNPARFSYAPFLVDQFLKANKNHPPKFIEVGCLGTRFDGFNGIADLIHDEGTGLRLVDERNIARILSKKTDLTKSLNQFLIGYSALKDDDENDLIHKRRHGELPKFLQTKLQELKKVMQADGTASEEDKFVIKEGEIDPKIVEQILHWQNESQLRVVEGLKEITKTHKVPLVFNSRFGHVANMSPIQSGPCHYSIKNGALILKSGIKREMVAKKEELQLPSPRPESPNAVVVEQSPQKKHEEGNLC